MNNYTKFAKNNITVITKYFFHTSNILLIIFYLYPGSIFGYLVYGNLNIQPQITNDIFSISSNHIYIFTII